ncbi:hypothetical protein [Streptomyces sp. NPDC001450]
MHGDEPLRPRLNQALDEVRLRVDAIREGLLAAALSGCEAVVTSEIAPDSRLGAESVGRWAGFGPAVAIPMGADRAARGVLFAAGSDLRGVRRFGKHPEAAERPARTVDDLDTTVDIIRSVRFGLHASGEGSQGQGQGRDRGAG